MNSRGWIHCDVDPANILLNDSGNSRLADFGLALRLESFSTGTRGHHNTMAPEMQQLHLASTKSDIYSLGVVALMMATLDVFENRQYSEPEFERIILNMTDRSEAMKDLLRLMLLHDPFLRRDFDELRHHPFLSLAEWDRLPALEKRVIPSAPVDMSGIIRIISAHDEHQMRLLRAQLVQNEQQVQLLQAQHVAPARWPTLKKLPQRLI
jgi:serine/threonine protein kinase